MSGLVLLYCAGKRHALLRWLLFTEYFDPSQISLAYRYRSHPYTLILLTGETMNFPLGA